MSTGTPGRRSVGRILTGLGLLLVGAGLAIIPGALSAPARARVVGGNVAVNAGAVDLRDIRSHNSPTLVRNPAHGGNLAVANRIDTPVYSCAFHVSFDGGARWAPTEIPIPEGEEPKCFAPEPAFGADGTLYLSYVTLQGLGNVPNAVWLATSRDGGRTLSAPARIPVMGRLAFQVRLVADPAEAGRLYLSWLQATNTATLAFPDTGSPINFARTDDAGATWQGPARVSDPSRLRVVAPSLAAGPRGELHVLYLDVGDDKLDYNGGHGGQGGEPYPGPWSLVLGSSHDGGATWLESVVEDGVVPTERFIVFLPPLPSLAVDPKRGRLYAGFADGRRGDADVAVWVSDDGGRGWHEPVRVNDTRPGDGTSQYRPRLSVAPGGRLDVVYYDRRGDRRDRMTDVSLQSSFDGGRTFSARTRLSDVAFDSRIGWGSERGLPDLGSRLAALSTEERALALWSDTRAGTEASNKQDLVQAVVEFARPKGLRPAAVAGLRAGGLALAALGLVMVVAGLAGRRPPAYAAGRR